MWNLQTPLQTSFIYYLIIKWPSTKKFKSHTFQNEFNIHLVKFVVKT